LAIVEGDRNRGYSLSLELVLDKRLERLNRLGVVGARLDICRMRGGRKHSTQAAAARDQAQHRQAGRRGEQNEFSGSSSTKCH
jgi:hypothetical protein